MVGVCGAGILWSTAGCLERVRSLELSTPVPITIQNTTALERNLTVTAYEIETNRQTYDEAVNAPATTTTSLGHLTNDDQQVTIELFPHHLSSDERDHSESNDGEQASESNESSDIVEVEQTLIGQNTQSLQIVITEVGLDLHIEYRS